MDRGDDNLRIKALPKELRDKVRSGCTVASLAQCVEELVYNAVDAGAKQIKVGVNIKIFKVQVEDDGRGLSRTDLEIVGKRNATSKLSSLKDFAQPKFYGYRGEALASIIEVSSKVKVITKHGHDGSTLQKQFKQGQPSRVSETSGSKRSTGCSVTVEGFLDAYPVRQKRLQPSIELEEIRDAVTRIALINPSISIELRNDENLSPLLLFNSCFSHVDAFHQVFKKMEGFQMESVNHLQGGLMFSAHGSAKMHRSKNYQFVFVNRRCIQARTKIHKFLNDAFIKILHGGGDAESPAKSDKWAPVFIIDIACSREKYFSQQDSKYSVEFYDWEQCITGLEGLLLKFQQCLYPSSKTIDLGRGRGKTRKQDLNKKCKDKLPLESKAKDVNKLLFARKDLSLERMKGFIQSKPACRKSPSPEPIDSPDTNAQLTKDRSGGQRSRSNSPDSRLNDDEAESVTYTTIEDSASQMVAPKFAPPWRKISTKYTKYNVRRSLREDNPSNKRELSSRVVRKDVIVPKRPKPKKVSPKLTRAIFNQFPLWKEDSQKGKCLEENQGTGLNVASRKRRPPSNGTSWDEENFAEKKRKFDAFVRESKPQLPSRTRTDKDANADKPLDVSSPIEGTSWKIQRFIKSLALVNQAKPNVESTTKTNAARAFESSKGSKPELARPATRDSVNTVNTEVSSVQSSRPYPSEELFSRITEELDAAAKSEAEQYVLSLGLDKNWFKDWVGKGIINIRTQLSSWKNHQRMPATTTKNQNPDHRDFFAVLQKTLGAELSRGEITDKGATPFFPSEKTFEKQSHHDTLHFPTLPEPAFRLPSFPPKQEEGVSLLKPTLPGTSRVAQAEVLSEVSDYFRVLTEIPLPVPVSSTEKVQQHVFPIIQTDIGAHPVTDTGLFGLVGSEREEESAYFSADPVDGCDSLVIKKDSLVEDTEWEDWDVEIVKDVFGGEWLQNVGENGHIIFTNLSTGETSGNINVVGTARTKMSDLRKNRNLFWMAKRFPKGFSEIIENNRNSTRPLIHGNMNVATSHISGEVKKCIEETLSFSDTLHPGDKWRGDELQAARQFLDTNGPSTTANNGVESQYFSNPSYNSTHDHDVCVTCELGVPTMRMTSNGVKFEKDYLNTLQVVNSWDRKFVICTMTVLDFDGPRGGGSRIQKKMLVVVDQHAAHERVLLEQFTDDMYEVFDGQKIIRSRRLVTPCEINVSDTELRILEGHQPYFKRLGIGCEFSGQSFDVEITSVPVILFDRAIDGNGRIQMSVLSASIQDLIRDEVQKIMDTKNVQVFAIPKIIFKILCFKACRGAVKFGDPLTMDECITLIDQLKQCQAPFQCAHGRPTIVPLCDIDSFTT